MDEGHALLHLLLVLWKSDDPANLSKAPGKPQRGRMHHGAVPALGIQPNAEMLSKAHPLKVRVERRLDDIRIGKQLNDDLRYFPLRQVDQLHRAIVKGVGQQEDLEVFSLCVSVHGGIPQVNTAVRLDVETHSPHVFTS